MDIVIIGLFFLVVFAVLSAFFSWSWYKTKNQLKASRQSSEKLKKDLNTLTEKTAPLWQYQKIIDAQEEANRLIDTAKSEARDSINSANKQIERAQQRASEIQQSAENRVERMQQRVAEIRQAAEKEAEAIRIEARNNARTTKEKAGEVLESAHLNAEKVIALANDRAKVIAGDALEAKGKSDHYEQKAKAMKNIIDGYGDEYLVATRTVLDGLAEEFGHKEGGVELKKARILSKSMVTSNRAASCDYVEPNRKDTAIKFVLDAFNGKVATALSKIKKDNYGKLAQEIKDAFGLVNGHGAAFRNARITEEYLMACLAVLKWGVITQDLLLQEREEQRRIKEAIREEEKARKEYEKAIRDAEKEERMLQQAMNKARQQLAGASEEQRKMYEDQIAELQAKYDEAEAKNQRALSMAQQTRRGHVYIISNTGSFGNHVYKIGLTRRLEPLDRVKELGDASVPFSFDIHAIIYAEDAPTLEKELHRHFDSMRMNKVNSRKEFFRASIKEIKEVVEKRGIECHWTMAADAREYHESLAIERTAALSVNDLGPRFPSLKVVAESAETEVA